MSIFKECAWKEDFLKSAAGEDRKFLVTSCNHFYIPYHIGTNFNFKYCPYCGKKLKVKNKQN